MTIQTQPRPNGTLHKDKAHHVLTALAKQGPLTADAYVAGIDGYVNSWAPTFTRLRKMGYVARTGDMAPTRAGASAHIIAITDEGRAVLAAADILTETS